jgi:hypothetical protein
MNDFDDDRRSGPRPDGQRRPTEALLLLALALGLLPSFADAQVRRGRATEEGPPWAPVTVGARFGWDQAASGQVLGAQVRIPVVRSGVVEVVPTAEMIFLTGTKEYQYNLEAAYVSGGTRGGLFAGGGIGWRDSVFGALDLDDPREWYFGWIATVGAKGGLGRLQFELALRWAFLNDTDYRPNSATLGLNYPLWRVVPEGS